MSKYFIAGTDTDVGKTIASAWAMLHLGASYWKPVQAGLADETDEAAVRRLTEAEANRFPPVGLRASRALVSSRIRETSRRHDCHGPIGAPGP